MVTFLFQIICHFQFLIVCFFIFLHLLHFSKCHYISLQNLFHSSKSSNSNISFLTNIHLSFHLHCPKKIIYFSVYYDCFLFYNNSSTTSCNSFSCATRTTYIVAYVLFLHHHTFLTFAFVTIM